MITPISNPQISHSTFQSSDQSFHLPILRLFIPLSNLQISQADSTFHLVMVAERMEESLVLLSHTLCVPLSEVAVIKINARKDTVSIE